MGTKATRDDEVLDAPDLNYWGVTFTSDSNVFYATLGTNNQTYLIRGDIAARTATVIRDNVQCPSLSPDGTRIAYKKLGEDDVTHFNVLKLSDMTDETVSVDDQLAWLNNDTVAYGTVDSAIYSLKADGSGAPTRLITTGQSPLLS